MPFPFLYVPWIPDLSCKANHEIIALKPEQSTSYRNATNPERLKQEVRESRI